MNHIYFIKFSRDRFPERHIFKTMEEMLEVLKMHLMGHHGDRGYIEWMIRE